MTRYSGPSFGICLILAKLGVIDWDKASNLIDGVSMKYGMHYKKYKTEFLHRDVHC